MLILLIAIGVVTAALIVAVYELRAVRADRSRLLSRIAEVHEDHDRARRSWENIRYEANETLIKEVERARVAEANREAERAIFAGDLQLERQRYTDLVEKVFEAAQPKITAPNQAAASHSDLPAPVASAIQDFAGADRRVAAYLERTARTMLADGGDPKAVAKKIRQGDRVTGSHEIPSDDAAPSTD